MEEKESTKARLATKLTKKKTSAMKEIQAWVNSSSEYLQIPEVTRNCGQLADNVTEERMLKAKLLELSKERYKFLVQKAYEKKLFSDRQMKKPELRHVILEAGRTSSKTPKRAMTSIRSKSHYTVSRIKSSQLPRSYTSVSWYKAGHGEDATAINIAQSETALQNSEQKTFIQAPSTEKVHSQETAEKGIVHETPLILQPVFSSKNLIIGQSKMMISHTDHDTSRQHLPDRLTSGLTSSSTANTQSNWHKDLPNGQSPWTTGQSTGITTNIKPSWQRQVNKQSSKYGSRVPSLTCDPRYVCLEQVLTPVVNNDNLNLYHIVDQIESLHVRPKKKVCDSKKTKIEIKALEYMRTRGYMF